MVYTIIAAPDLSGAKPGAIIVPILGTLHEIMLVCDVCTPRILSSARLGRGVHAQEEERQWRTR